MHIAAATVGRLRILKPPLSIYRWRKRLIGRRGSLAGPSSARPPAGRGNLPLDWRLTLIYRRLQGLGSATPGRSPEL